jgi:hypothetical protein
VAADPYLRGIRSFAEPCAGDGALVEDLEAFGLRWVYSGDILVVIAANAEKAVDTSTTAARGSGSTHLSLSASCL